MHHLFKGKKQLRTISLVSYVELCPHSVERGTHWNDLLHIRWRVLSSRPQQEYIKKLKKWLRLSYKPHNLEICPDICTEVQ